MTFWGHLNELRRRLLRALIVVAALLFASFPFAENLFRILTRPLYSSKSGSAAVSLIYTGPAEVFVAFMKVSLVATLIVAAPYLFWEVWGFVSPGLKEREKRMVVPFVGLTTLFFVVGVLFGYFVMLPVGYGFFLGYAPNYITAQIRISEYLSFSTSILLGCGLVFEAPLLVVSLVYLGVIRTALLAQHWRIAIIAISIAAAVFTPPDVMSMCLLGVPLLILYGLSLLMGYLVERARVQPPV
jgi:sec-independent protein translocase protein TatC